MPYVKIEDGIFRNPKVVSVSSGAKLLYVASICYSGSSLTDGFVPFNAVRMIAADAALPSSAKPVKELVSVGLWKEAAGGYQVHDYLAYNESSEKVQAKKEAARERMNARRSQNEQRTSQDVRANGDGNSREVREPTTDTETTTDTPQQAGERKTPKPPSSAKVKNGELPTVQHELFERWYAVYPKKVGRIDAVRAWSHIASAPTDELVNRMIAKVQEWDGSEPWTSDGGKYIPNPATWLNRGQWDDGSPPPPQSANVTHLGGAANARASPDESIATRQLRESRERREREESQREGRTA